METLTITINEGEMPDKTNGISYVITATCEKKKSIENEIVFVATSTSDLVEQIHKYIQQNCSSQFISEEN